MSALFGTGRILVRNRRNCADGSRRAQGRRRLGRGVLLWMLLPAMAAVSGTVVVNAAARGGSGAELAAALARAADAARGAELYRNCAACHGVDGGGVADGSIPAIAGQPQPVLVKQLIDFRRGARLDIRMEHFADRRHLESPQDIADVAAYTAALRRTTPAGIGSGAELATGSRAWLDSCSGCHGATGQGDAARKLPRLAGQHAGYLERQLLDTADGRRSSMTAIHRKTFKRLSPEQIAGIADYLSRQQ